MGFPKGLIFRQKPYVSPTQEPYSSSINGVANRAMFVPVAIFARQTFTKLRWRSGTNVVNNYDVGLYDALFNALYRKGSTAMPLSSTEVTEVISLDLAPGIYWFAIALNTTGSTAQVSSGTGNRTGKTIKFQNNAFPLPAIATPSDCPDAAVSTDWQSRAASFVLLP